MAYKKDLLYLFTYLNIFLSHYLATCHPPIVELAWYYHLRTNFGIENDGKLGF